MKRISFVLPVYNEELGLDKLYMELEKIIDELKDNYIIDVIFINDGSKDNSLYKLVDIHNKDNKYKVINFSRNFGHQMALSAGLDFAEGDAVVIMDSDLQDPPKIALDLISKWNQGYDVVYAQRRTRKDTFIKKLTASLFYRLLDSLSDIKIPRDTGDFRLMDRKVVLEFRKLKERNRFIRGLVPYLGFKQAAVLFDRDERFAGHTEYTLKKMIKLALDALTGFSTIPLKWIMQLGSIVSLLSFFGIIYELFVKIFYPNLSPSGTTFIVSSILFIGGAQMIMLGIVGTYVGRIYSQVQERPLYIIDSVYS